MSRTADSDSESFLAEIEARHGGQISFKTFSTFYADNDGNVRDYGVFFYMIDGTFWYQDFEHERSFLGFRLNKPKDEPEYKMFESSFNPSDVQDIRIVRKNRARSCAMGFRDFGKLSKAGFLTRLFCETATEFKLTDGRVLYFQFMDRTAGKMIKGE